RIEVENAWPNPRFDLWSVLDLAFYRGIDTLHGFRRPRFATPLYHRVVRRLAGVGRLAHPSLGGRPGTTHSVEVDVAVVGGGESGRACAERLRTGGRTVHVIDRGRAGGPRTPTSGHTVAFLPPPTADAARPFVLLGSREDGAGLLVHASKVVVATGGYDANLLFDGNDRPGVVTGDGAEALAGPDGSPPFRHAVLFGGSERTAELLDRFGERVEAIVAPGPIPPTIAERASRFDVPLYPRTLLIGTRGRSRVRGVVLRPRGGGPTFSLTVDAVVLTHRRLPTAQLFFQSGARMAWRAGVGAYFPVLGAGVETSVPGLYAAGEAAGFLGREGARRSGELAAEQILGRDVSELPPRVEAERPGEMLGYFHEVLPDLLRRRRPVLCPCEDVLLRELEEAHQAGYRGMEVVKRYTGVGTGLCQGRYCLPDVLLLLSILEGRPPAEVGYITQRPPVFPAPLDALARIELPAEAAA
ncbi:MAG TPA: (2Fe-2S)-binding protein, partial [Thermoplasmata archaeon]|nr:(2Fe-2S)-binding protein [Thermoplasmata archaeon]